MSSVIQKTCGALLMALTLSACSMSRQVSSFSIDYNRAIASSRDEMLLLNILRAKEREPFQFTTVSGVTGSLEMSGSVEGSADKLVEWRAGDKPKDIASFSPKLTLSTSSKPTFSVQPLSDKEFTSQMLTPVAPEMVDQLLNQGWDTEFILPLVIASIECGGVTRPNSYNPARDELAKIFSENQWKADLVAGNGPVDEAITLAVAADKLPEMLHNGVGEGREIEVLSADQSSQTVRIRIVKPGDKVWTIMDLPQAACPANQASALRLFRKNMPSALAIQNGGAGVQFRSIEAIIYYLGEALRNKKTISYWSDCSRKAGTLVCPTRKILFRVDVGQPTSTPAVETDINGQHYWIRRSTDDLSDRTLSTLSVLSELIALRTREDSKAQPQPVVVVGR